MLAALLHVVTSLQDTYDKTVTSSQMGHGKPHLQVCSLGELTGLTRESGWVLGIVRSEEVTLTVSEPG